MLFTRGKLVDLSRVVLLLLAVLLLVGCQSGTAETGNDYPNGALLVDTAWLAERTDDSDGMRIIDMRPRSAYVEAHIPGAVNVPISALSVENIPLEFDQSEVEEALSAAGLEPGMTAVVYDNLGMLNAARMFWTLEYVGHEDVRVLDGGWNAWLAEDRETSAEAVQVESSNYPTTLQADKIATAEQILARLDDPEVTIVDARSPAEYTGEVTYADQAGHIPGAVNLAWLEALTGGDAVHTTEDDWTEQLRDADVERFKSAAEIQALLDERGINPDQEIITYCQTFWRGAHLYFLLRLMGFEQVRGYDGSWAEWGNRPDLPVVTGTEPG